MKTLHALCLFPVLFSSLAHALPERESRFLLGHNLNPTSAVLNQGEASVGTYAISYGLSDSLTVSTSPWIDLNYNMPMADLKFGIPLELGIVKRLSIETIYFKTVPFLFNLYVQTSTMERLTTTLQFEDFKNYRLHVTLNYQHFWTYDIPYSLRMLPNSTTDTCIPGKIGYCGPRDTWSFGLLHQFDLNENWGMFVETGLLGFNYSNPYTHVGLSVFYITRGLLAQLGLSYSRSLSAVHAAFQTPSAANSKTLVQGVKDGGNFDLAHPEIQLQFPL
jgi:hypothetical protein